MVALLWVVALLNSLDRIMLITMQTSIKEAIPTTDAPFGLPTTIFLVVYGVLSLGIKKQPNEPRNHSPGAQPLLHSAFCLLTSP
jgi:hypothetical protein